MIRTLINGGFLVFRCKSLLLELNIVLGMTRINNDDVELTVDEDVAYLVGR